jgi:cell wall-associated NlpC family hydrolase
MSFSDAVGQIDQIVQWEQQLTNPAALTQTTSTGAAATTGDTSNANASDSSTSASFATALADAQAQDGSEAISTLDPTASTASTDSTDASSLLDASDPTGTSSASGLLSGGDSQLLAALSSLTGSGSTGSTSSTNELSALESALESAGTSSATGATATTAAGDSGPAEGVATSASDPRVQSMTEEANALVGKPYVWGGGHDGWGPQSGYDCSGFVSAVLHAGGYLSTPEDTTTLPTASGIESGPGQYVTIYDRDKPGQSGHVIIDIAGQFYESGGEQGSWGGGGGVEQISTPSASYLASFDQVLHPTGL